MAKPITLFGGPLDGKQLPPSMAVVEWIAFAVAHANNNTVTYNYMFDENTNRFNFVGEDSEEDSE